MWEMLGTGTHYKDAAEAQGLGRLSPACSGKQKNLLSILGWLTFPLLPSPTPALTHLWV